MAFAISIGKWGGFYCHTSKMSARVCVGWIAFTLLRFDLDVVLEKLLEN